MYYVYLLQSLNFPDQRYVGFTSDLKERLKAHNSDQSKHTSKYYPWELISYHAFQDKRRAQEFEYYLKTGSGKAFANKRFWWRSFYLAFFGPFVLHILHKKQ